MPRELTFEQYWPTFPEDKAATPLVHEDAQCDAASLFRVIFASQSAFQTSARAARGAWDYAETEWLTDASELPALPGGFSWTAPVPSGTGQLAMGDYQGRMRKACFQSTNSLKTEELQRCIVADPGRQFIVDCTVAVTAPYGDSFRAVCRYTITQSNPKRCTLQITYAMAYTQPIMGFIKSLIERGAESGIAKNFQQFMLELRSHVPIISMSADDGDSLEHDSTSLPQPVPGSQFLDTPDNILRQESLLTHGGTRRRMHKVGTHFVDEHLLSVFLPLAEAMFTYTGLETQGVRSAGVQAISWILSSALVLFALQGTLSLYHGFGGLCTQSQFFVLRACSHVYRLVDLPRNVTGMVVVVCLVMGCRALLGWMAQHVVRVRTTRASADPIPVVAETQLGTDANPSQDVLAGAALTPAGSTGTSSPKTTDETAASSDEVSSRVAEQRENIHLTRLAAVGRWVIGRNSVTAPSHSKPAHGSDSPRQIVMPSESQIQTGKHSHLQLLNSLADDHGAMAFTWAKSAPKLDQVHATPLTTIFKSSPLRSSTPSLNANPIATNFSDITNSTGSSPLSPPRASDHASLHTVTPEYKTPPPHNAASIFHSPAADVVIECVYENERKQPFRGWGHLWPGHFLPTDTIGHWCTGKGKSAGGGHRFSECAPRLPEGWTWCGDWEVEVSGINFGACDTEGWWYSLDFWGLPFGESGRSKGTLLACVRRRRWVRTRVPLSWSTHMSPTTLSEKFSPTVYTLRRERPDIRGSLSTCDSSPVSKSALKATPSSLAPNASSYACTSSVAWKLDDSDLGNGVSLDSDSSRQIDTNSHRTTERAGSRNLTASCHAVPLAAMQSESEPSFSASMHAYGASSLAILDMALSSVRGTTPTSVDTDKHKAVSRSAQSATQSPTQSQSLLSPSHLFSVMRTHFDHSINSNPLDAPFLSAWKTPSCPHSFAGGGVTPQSDPDLDHMPLSPGQSASCFSERCASPTVHQVDGSGADTRSCARAHNDRISRCSMTGTSAKEESGT